MTATPDDRSYTKEHEWAQQDGDRIVVGITDYAQDQLGDVVFVEMPEAGTEVEAGKALGEVESTKSVSDIYSPVTGTVLERNQDLEHNPEAINEDPYGKGWMVAIDPAEGAGLEGLMTAVEYRSMVGEG